MGIQRRDDTGEVVKARNVAGRKLTKDKRRSTSNSWTKKLILDPSPVRILQAILHS
jgi:hypothetical protein